MQIDYQNIFAEKYSVASATGYLTNVIDFGRDGVDLGVGSGDNVAQIGFLVTSDQGGSGSATFDLRQTSTDGSAQASVGVSAVVSRTAKKGDVIVRNVPYGTTKQFLSMHMTKTGSPTGTVTVFYSPVRITPPKASGISGRKYVGRTKRRAQSAVTAN